MPTTKKPALADLQALWLDIFTELPNLAVLVRVLTEQDDVARAVTKELTALPKSAALLVVLNRLSEDSRKGVGSMASVGWVHHTSTVPPTPQKGKER